MKFLSVCSGIEAASVAWHPLGWRAHAFAENEKFPSAVLAHHYPDVPNWGDITKFKDWPDATLDLLVGGTPCQSFSVAGLRKGLADPRGNLALVYLGILDRYRPRWMVWENVPGVLSSSGGRDFGAFLGGLAELGYGFAYRVLDAQYVRVDGLERAVPQRRRRVFVVGYLGDWRRPAAVLFERESLSGNPAPGRQPGQRPAPTLSARTQGGGGLGTDFDCDGGLIAFGGNNQSGSIDVATACRAKGGSGHGDFESKTFVMQSAGVAGTLGNNGKAAGTATGQDAANGLLVAQSAIAFKPSHYTRGKDGAPSVVAPALSADADKGNQDTLVCFDETQITNAENRSNPQPGDPSHPLAAQARVPAIAFRTTGNDGVYETGDAVSCLNTATDPNQNILMQNWRVRRLMPVECERLQGFPEITKCVTIRAWDWSDKAKNAALAEMLNRKSQKSVLNADANELVRSAETAESHSNAYHQSHGSRAAVNVRINSERSEVEIRRTGKLIWSARIAERPSASPLLMPLDDFVRLVAPMLTMLESGIHAGAEELPASINASSHPLNGSACVNLSGDEIAENVGDADKFTAAINNCMRFTTSGVGRSSPNSEPLWKTWCCCVVHAIGSCIPDETRATSSFDLSVELVSGYTAIPYRGKPSADGPRYKALGNSFAVNVMRWIGQRIQIADSI